jgi:hypothetical protein
MGLRVESGDGGKSIFLSGIEKCKLKIENWGLAGSVVGPLECGDI